MMKFIRHMGRKIEKNCNFTRYDLIGQTDMYLTFTVRKSLYVLSVVNRSISFVPGCNSRRERNPELSSYDSGDFNR